MRIVKFEAAYNDAVVYLDADKIDGFIAYPEDHCHYPNRCFISLGQDGFSVKATADDVLAAWQNGGHEPASNEKVRASLRYEPSSNPNYD